ncbi:MAG TPA: signal peptidase II [Candidatus Krumholzibacteria bacterium]|nr:signal peptidase II [Candidatus Krumholzibacteria bacterium]
MALFLPAILIVVVDQITKYLFWSNGRNYVIVDGFFNITLVKNAGAAFGMFQGGRAFFIVASIVAAVLITYLGMKLPREERSRRIWLGLILGGAVGNLIDRARFGEVVDFLQIGFKGHYWPVFNVADIGVTVGATMLILYALIPHRAGRPLVADAPGTAAPGPAAEAAGEDAAPRV